MGDKEEKKRPARVRKEERRKMGELCTRYMMYRLGDAHERGGKKKKTDKQGAGRREMRGEDDMIQERKPMRAGHKGPYKD
jgi:hypothetical protein